MNKNELRKVSVQFRTLASQMLKVENDTEVGYINMFVDYIDSTPVTSKYIAACHTKEYDIVADMKSKRNWQPVTLPSKQEELIDYVYQLLKLISEDMKLLRAWAFEYSASNKMVDKYQTFMRKTVEPFVHVSHRQGTRNQRRIARIV